MNPSIAQEISLFKELLSQNNDFGIVVGIHQNLDTYASSLALYATLKQIGKNVQIISRKEPTVEVSSLVGIDKVRPRFTAGSSSKLVISLPYIKGEVEKVLFTEFPNPQNPTNINFHLTAAEGKSITPFDLKNVKLLWDGGAPAVIIAVGVSSIDELSEAVDTNSTKIVNIDNFSGNTRFGDIVLVDDMFSSLSEISGKIIKDLNLPSDIDSAQNILDGVLFATKNFTKPNTSPFAFEAASTAMYNGAKRQSRGGVSQEFREKPRAFEDRQNDPIERVSENDFPAMHMQGSRDQRDQRSDERRPKNQRRNEPRRGGQNRQFEQNRPQQSFGQNPSDIEELMRKINEENAKRGSNRDQNQSRQDRSNLDAYDNRRTNISDQNERVQDAEVVEDKVEAQPLANDNVPEERPYIPPSPDEVPDDWLTPKVFKSSKNNN